MNNENDTKLFLKMIDASINNKVLDLSNISEDFIRIAKEQTFLPFLYVASKNKLYKKYYFQSQLIHEKFNKIGEKIDQVLNDNKINHIFLKGYEIQKLYPDENLRMLGDIDLLVESKDHQKAVSVLIENGFEKGPDDPHHMVLIKNNVLIELHHNLFEDFRRTVSFFSTPFEFTKKSNYFRKYLIDEYNFLYIVAHYAKHICVGAGLRGLIDIYLFIKNKDLDFNFINLQLQNLGLAKFYNMILSEIFIIFGYKDKYLSFNDQAMSMIEYSLKCGIHGQGNNHNMNYASKTITRFNQGNKFKYLLSKLFISPKDLFKKYPWTKTIILIPFGYIYRFFYLLIKKSDNLNDALHYKKSDDFYLLKSLDLIKNDGKSF